MKKMLVTLLVLTASGIAAAVTPSPAPVVLTPLPETTNPVLSTLTALLAPLASAALLALAGFGSTWLHQKTKLVQNDQLRQALDVLGELALAKVAELAVSVETLKSARSGGTLSNPEKRAAQQTAVTEIWQGLPAWAQALLKAAAGSERLALDNYVLPKVEQAVTAIGRSGSLVEVARGRSSEADLAEARRRLGLSR